DSEQGGEATPKHHRDPPAETPGRRRSASRSTNRKFAPPFEKLVAREEKPATTFYRRLQAK
ncbi:unnamed protein product, partial [Arabidopsis halleri]